MLQSKDIEWLNGYKNKIHIYATYRRLTSNLQTYRLLWKKKARVAILVSDKIDFKIKTVTRDKEGHHIMIKGSIQEEDITIVIRTQHRTT